MNQRISNTRNRIDRLLQELETKIEPDLKMTASLCKAGNDLGKAIREYIELNRLELNLRSFMANYNYNHNSSYHWKTCITECDIDRYRISHCPDAEYCPYSKNVHLGNMLCLLDHAILDGFDPELDANVASSMKLGSYNYWFESEITLSIGN